MSWKIEIKPSVEKQYRKLDKKTRKRFKNALLALEKENNPLLAANVRPLTGELRGDYRVRTGKWRVLFTPDEDKKIINIYAIIPRGDAY
jgi:mRNA interferase RelE/StbE